MPNVKMMVDGKFGNSELAIVFFEAIPRRKEQVFYNDEYYVVRQVSYIVGYVFQIEILLYPLK